MKERIRCKSITLALSLLFSLPLLIDAQSTQKGGFYYGWDEYSSDPNTGLGELMVEFDTTHLVSIKHAPAPGVHPRIYFGPSEKNEILYRLDSLESGRHAKKLVQAYTRLLHLGWWSVSGGTYDRHAEYAKDDYGNRLIGNEGAWDNSQYYVALKTQDTTTVLGLMTNLQGQRRFTSMLGLEALLCYLYSSETDPIVGLSYETRTQDLIDAVYFWAELIVKEQFVSDLFSLQHLAICYDLLYNEMTSNQQDIIRQALSRSLPEYPIHCSYVNAYATTSNWVPIHFSHYITNFALEGEDGFKEELNREYMRMMYNFSTYGWYPSGAGFEGLGKNFFYSNSHIAMAKRGYSLLGHPHLRAVVEDFIPAISHPFGTGINAYDQNGGSGIDNVQGYKFYNSGIITGMKFAEPDNPKIDFVWRTYLTHAFNVDSARYHYQKIDPRGNELLTSAIFAADFDESLSWQAHADSVVETNYIAKDRGLAVLKSSTDQNALQLQFHSRQDKGGHTNADRLSFNFSGLGRIWVRQNEAVDPITHSVVLIDDLGTAILPGQKTVFQPSKILNYSFSDQVSQVSGDATYPYKYIWGGTGENVNETWNDFLFEPRSEPLFNDPIYDHPSWLIPFGKERFKRDVFHEVEKVVRTVGMLKGEHPMALIIDDVKKDENVHNYKWMAQLAWGLEIDHFDVQLTDEDYKCDIIIKEPAEQGNRRLLVRAININDYDGQSNLGTIESIHNTLVIEANSVTPDFKMLLFPYMEGEELPQTYWNSNRDTLTITFSDEVKKVHFYQDESGNTQFQLICEDMGTNIPPVASSSKQSVIGASSVMLDGTTSYDPDNGPSDLTYHWTLPSGTTLSLSDPTHPTPTLSGLVPSETYVLELKVFDGQDTSLAAQKIIYTSDNRLPIADAGIDAILLLPTNSTQLLGESTYDLDDQNLNYLWTQVSGPNMAIFESPDSASTIINGLVSGLYVFNLQVNDGIATDNDQVEVLVYSDVAQTPFTIHHIPGIIESEDFDFGGQDIAYFDTDTINAGGAYRSEFVDISEAFGGHYLWGVKNHEWLEYTIASVDSGYYDIHVYFSGSNGHINRNTHVYLDGDYLGYVEAHITGGNNDWASLSIDSVYLEGGVNQLMRVEIERGFFNLDKIIFEPSTSNAPPDANAGPDFTITLPTVFSQLNGSGTDPDNSLLTYEWYQISGPNNAAIENPDSQTTIIANLTEGTYIFELAVSDLTQTSTDQVVVTVVQSNPPLANAGLDRIITLPEDSTELNGSASVDPDGPILYYLWCQISGPNNATIENPTTEVTAINGLIEGTYEFVLAVSDQYSTDYDTVKVEVLPFSVGTTEIVQEGQIYIYPNPAEDYFFIKTENIDDYLFSIFDINGRLLKQEMENTDLKRVEVADLNTGIYLIEVTSESQRYRSKIIKL